jgi:hypothetical protein
VLNIKSRFYQYYRYGDRNAYGQPTLSNVPSGEVKIAIFTTSQSIQDNINYKDANYIGLTMTSLLDDRCVIQYGDKKLKVLYVNPEARVKQVFLKEI